MNPSLGGVRRHHPNDFGTFHETLEFLNDGITAAGKVTAEELNELISLRMVEVEKINDVPKIAIYKFPGGLTQKMQEAILHSRAEKKRKPLEARPINERQFSTLDHMGKKVGCDGSVLRQLHEAGEFVGQVCPVTGELHVNKFSFDCWLRDTKNQSRLRHAQRDYVARQSAAKIAADAEKKSEAEILAEGRALENERLLAARAPK